MIGVVFLGWFWYLYPYNVVEWKSETYPVLTSQVKAGGNLLMVSEYCKYYDVQPEITRVFTNGLVYYSPSTRGSTGTGCTDEINIVGVEIPHELPPGKYTMTSIFRYKVNPIRTITYQHTSDQFEVL